MFKKGQDVTTVPGLWHDGVDIGERLATILSAEGHIIIKVHDYSNNPVKVFRWEIEHYALGEQVRTMSDNDIEELLDEYFPKMYIP